MLKSQKHLSVLAKITPETLKLILNDIDSRYKSYHKTKRDYVTNKILTNNDGSLKTRPISFTCDKALGLVQKVIFKHLSTFELPKHIHGGVKKKSNITNAASHLNYKYHFITDLEKFYPSIKFKMVKDTFVSCGHSKTLSVDLAILTTYGHSNSRHNAYLPQGTKTSPILANLYFLKTDRALQVFCEANEIIYTRFVDDLTFSSHRCFKDKQTEIINIILSSGIKINRQKTHYKIGSIEITGVKVFRSDLYFSKKTIDKISYLLENPKDIRYKDLSSLISYGQSIKKISKLSRTETYPITPSTSPPVSRSSSVAS